MIELAGISLSNKHNWQMLLARYPRAVRARLELSKLLLPRRDLQADPVEWDSGVRRYLVRQLLTDPDRDRVADMHTLPSPLLTGTIPLTVSTVLFGHSSSRVQKLVWGTPGDTPEQFLAGSTVPENLRMQRFMYLARILGENQYFKRLRRPARVLAGGCRGAPDALRASRR